MMAAYLRLSSSKLQRKALLAGGLIKKCVLCPRRCAVDRTGGERGFCRVLDKPLVSSWGPHFGEERPLVGRFGSGTIFFSRCNLGCLFCQNWTISHQGEGTELSIDKLAGIMMELQDMGCHNINFVTPTHQMPMMLEALTAAKGEGLKLPIVYNCGGYESLQALEILDGIVDIYMPDLKYADTLLSLKYSGAEGYPEAAKTAIKEMHRQVGDLILDERGIAVRGLLVRHLVLPENMAGTDEVVRFLSQDISPDTYLNIMDQYHPCYRAKENPPLDRRITGSEYRTAITLAVKAGIKRLDGVTV